MCIFGFQIYLLFFKTHTNGLSNRFIPTLSLIPRPLSPLQKKEKKNLCNLWTLVLGCFRKHGHWNTHVFLKYIQTKIQIFVQNLPCMVTDISIAGLAVFLICINYSKFFDKYLQSISLCLSLNIFLGDVI